MKTMIALIDMSMNNLDISITDAGHYVPTGDFASMCDKLTSLMLHLFPVNVRTDHLIIIPRETEGRRRCRVVGLLNTLTLIIQETGAVLLVAMYISVHRH